MHDVKPDANLFKEAHYRELTAQLAALLVGERNGLANAANLTALSLPVNALCELGGILFPARR